MKKLIVLIMFTLIIVSCKKKEKAATAEDVYCCFYNNGNARTFYKCAKTQSEMQQYAIEIRDNNLGSLETTRKSTCSECN